MISIITIVRNQKDFIEETIKSVLLQNVPNLEYIIIDGASTDGTLEIINKYKDKISKIVSEKDDGIYDAINKGIRLANFPIIGLINSSDVYVSGILNKIVKFYYDSPKDVIYGDIMFREDELTESFMSFGIANHNKLDQYMSIYHPSTFISKYAYERVGLYNLKYSSASDYDLLLRLYLNNYSFSYFPEVVSVFRKGGMSGHSNFINNVKENYLIRVRNLGMLNSIKYLIKHLGLSIFFYSRRLLIIKVFGYKNFVNFKKFYNEGFKLK
jgi:glycosyltransferase involved in cell wall biosynthesis